MSEHPKLHSSDFWTVDGVTGALPKTESLGHMSHPSNLLLTFGTRFGHGGLPVTRLVGLSVSTVLEPDLGLGCVK